MVRKILFIVVGFCAFMGVLPGYAVTMSEVVGANNQLLATDWYIESSEKVSAQGAEISLPGFNTDTWYITSVPSTVMNTLLSNNYYKDVFFGDTIAHIPRAQFEKPWWYRKEFNISSVTQGQNVKINFDGIVYKANVWLNGKLVANSNTVAGVFRRFELDVSKFIKFGEKNVLAVEVIPPVRGEFSVGFVDWNPPPPDNNLGIWREVRVKVSGDVSIGFPFIKTKLDLATLEKAALSVSAEVTNNSAMQIAGVLAGQIEEIKFSQQVLLEPYEKKIVTFVPDTYPQLAISKPRIWWTHNYGAPELYRLNLTFLVNGKTSDRSTTRFGIREVADYINAEGHRGYMLNGRKIVIFGGGWTDDLFLKHDRKNLKAQINYVKHMGLNAIRLEGFWGNNEDLYDLCDENGILLMAGFSCQWEWEAYSGKPHDEFGSIKSSADMQLIALSWKDQVRWLRNHPAILVWLPGSDKLPRPELERMYLGILQEEDPTRPYLASATGLNSVVSGPTRVKMRGPYDYVPPVYWWEDRKFGGAYGFNTETGPGPQVPPLESIKKMIPANHLWPIDSMWDFHSGRGIFKNLARYNEAINNRLGAAESLEEYVGKAQFVNYEAVRAMYEAFAGNKHTATGVIQWMLNASWPKLWWQLYDHYLMPNGAFYGAKKALAPVQLIYNYDDSGIIAVNNTNKATGTMVAKVRVIDFSIRERFAQEVSLSLAPDGIKKLFTVPRLQSLSRTYFLDLRLYDASGNMLSNNFYTLSTKEDVLDYANSTWFVTPMKQFADLTDLNGLGSVALINKSSFRITGDKHEVTVELTNSTNELAFQIELAVLKRRLGESILPIFWEDNYFSLLPGETRIIKGYFFTEDLQGEEPEVKISGWNVI